MKYKFLTLLAVAALFIGFAAHFGTPAPKLGAAPYTPLRTILPESDNTYDLGSSTKRWKNLYVTSCTGCGTGGGGSFTTTTIATGPTTLSSTAYTFATTSDPNIGLEITGSGSTLTFSPTWGGPLPATRGGTDQTGTVTGDMLFADGSNHWAALGIGSEGHLLAVSGGVPTWLAPTGGGGGSPGGSDTQIQFNDGGAAFAGDAGLAYDKTLKALTFENGDLSTSLFHSAANPILVLTGDPSGYNGGTSSPKPYIEFQLPTSTPNYVELTGAVASSSNSLFDFYADAGDAYLFLQGAPGSAINFDTLTNSSLHSDGGMDFKLGGTYKIAAGGNTNYAVFDTSALASSDKTFTFPNQSGTLCTSTSGSGVPGSTPAAVGQVYVDTSGGKVYVSTGTSSSADWKILN